MATKSVSIIISTIGASAGPFNISDNVLGVVAINVSRDELLAGYTLNVDESATEIIVASVGACTNTISIYLSTPTPTPTPTITGTPTISPTPTQSPIYFDTAYTSRSNVQGSGGRIWSRLVGPSGSVVELTVKAQQSVTSAATGSTNVCISGGLFETSLPSANPTPGTQITASLASISTGSIPYYLSDTQITTVTIPAIGYKDYILVYRTKNIGANYSNGQFSATITKVNGTTITGGDNLSIWYNFTDIGTC